MCLQVQGLTIGNPLEAHCSLFHAVERIAAGAAGISELWDERFAGHTAEEIFVCLMQCYFQVRLKAARAMRLDSIS